MDKDDARIIAAQLINCGGPYSGDLIIVDDAIVETVDAWVFFYQHRRWIEQQDRDYRLSGNLPVAVDKITGNAKLLPHSSALVKQIHQWQHDKRSRNRKNPGIQPGGI